MVETREHRDSLSDETETFVQAFLRGTSMKRGMGLVVERDVKRDIKQEVQQDVQQDVKREYQEGEYHGKEGENPAVEGHEDKFEEEKKREETHDEILSQLLNFPHGNYKTLIEQYDGDLCNYFF
eukprot:TRINITY_DN990_c0_g1_i1.p3 TRINITY_DN990_c0_g1~~TRINITY_DN990_c0_g1_i1.p3  ORF type:complete len:124 (+),score=33.55 TRINITY_DN990_c0_g1_i1:733-1104(+)